MNNVIAMMLVSLVVGGAIGGGVTSLVLTSVVSCPVTPSAPDGMAALLKPTPIPLTGYKSY